MIEEKATPNGGSDWWCDKTLPEFSVQYTGTLQELLSPYVGSYYLRLALTLGGRKETFWLRPRRADLYAVALSMQNAADELAAIARKITAETAEDAEDKPPMQAAADAVAEAEAAPLTGGK